MLKAVFLFLTAVVLVLAGGHHDYEDGHAHYKFEYGVHDPHSKDLKYQHEHRDGKHLTGGYGLKEPDGTHRVVKYRASPHTGFEAVVARHGHAKHPPVYGKYHKKGSPGGTSYVGIVHWDNQGPAEHGGHGGHGGHGYQVYDHADYEKYGY